MKPKRLEFCGVKSYTDKTVVDFDKLLSNGLFGIFGPTGSGKSTILDCIFLGLYGELPKTSSRDDFINTKIGSCYVNFTFEIFYGGKRRIYEVRREYKLKGDRKAQPQPKANLYEVEGDDRVPLEENVTKVNERLEEIIGLSIDDFEKCIVLPQGQFSAFVTLKRSDRLKMVSGLFNLDKYGDRLELRLKSAINDYDAKIAAKEEVLNVYSDADKDALARCEKEVDDCKKLLETEAVKFAKKKEEFSVFEKNYDRRKKLDSLISELYNLEKLKPEIDGKKWLLERFDRAKLVKAAFDEKEGFLTKLTKNKTAAEEAENKISSLTVSLEKVESELEKEPLYRQRIEEIVSVLSRLEDLKKDQADNEKEKEKLSSLRNEIKTVIEKINSATSLLERHKENLLGIKNCDEYINLPREIEREIDRLVASSKNLIIREEVDFLRSLKNLGGDDLSAVQQRIKVLLEMTSDDPFSQEESVKRLNTLYERSDALNRSVAEEEGEIVKLQSQLLSLSDKKDDVTERGTLIRSRVEQTEQKILALTGGKVLNDYISALTTEKVNTENLLTTLDSKLKNLNGSLSSLKTDLASLKAERVYLEDGYKKAQAAYDDLIKDFKDLAQVYSILREVGDNGILRAQIDEYEKRLITLVENKKELENQLDGVEITENDYQKRLAEVNLLDKNIKEININYEILSNNYKNLSQNFEKRCKIEREVCDLGKEREVYSVLFEGVKGKRLLEYIADEYLSEIALDGKKILLDLTSGKYGLIYRGDFYVEDYGQGGEARGVATLSGGELFLVSLSLALALSKSIYSRSMRPIEFFFLDEGFGSLDKELIEVVMDCLDKLRNSQFAIGIISHVDGLKERIPVKVNVTGAKGDKGSAITVA